PLAPFQHVPFVGIEYGFMHLITQISELIAHDRHRGTRRVWNNVLEYTYGGVELCHHGQIRHDQMPHLRMVFRVFELALGPAGHRGARAWYPTEKNIRFRKL